jgi:hypothetical protein
MASLVQVVPQSLTTVCTTISASPSTRAVIGRPPGTMREDFRARVALQWAVLIGRDPLEDETLIPGEVQQSLRRRQLRVVSHHRLCPPR